MRPIDFNDYIEWEELYGLHTLTGVDILEDAGEGMICLFRLDGDTYAATEDPDDGYRSYFSSIYTTDKEPKIIFDEEQVIICGCNTTGQQGIQILNAKTGLIILELSTVALDDYYPSCRFEYFPENLSANYDKDDD